jgi:hypothetical protein
MAKLNWTPLKNPSASNHSPENIFMTICKYRGMKSPNYVKYIKEY